MLLDKKIWLSGMMGLVVGDALGVPVEFTRREELKANPVTGMREYGTHEQPRGTWSDDSSMALAALDSIHAMNGIDYEDIMLRFEDWVIDCDYTPFKNVFDMGYTCADSVMKHGLGMPALQCGGTKEKENGNGSLMRIMPFCLYAYEREKSGEFSTEQAMQVIHEASSLTHAHMRSKIGCGLYYQMVKAIIDTDGNLIDRLQIGLGNGFDYYRQFEECCPDLEAYNRLTDLWEFKNTPEEEIKSTGYVVHTLEAAVWSLINSDSYDDALLKAVNLGGDTDTVGAVTGGLAGLFYGYDAINKDWLASIQQKEWVEGIITGAVVDKRAAD